MKKNIICLLFVLCFSCLFLDSIDALSLKTPKITSFASIPDETNALKIVLNNNGNTGSNYSYEVINSTTGKTNNLSGSVKQYVYQNLATNTEYKIIARVCSNEKYVCSNWTPTVKAKLISNSSGLMTPTINKLDLKNNININVKYSISGNVSGVEIFNVTTNKTTRTTNHKNYTLTGLKNNTNYKIKIRTYKIKGNNFIYSNYSNVKSIKTKGATLKTPTLSKATALSDTSIKLTYKTKGKISGVEIYNVTTGKKYNTTRKKDYTQKKLGKNKTYKYKIRTYLKKNGIVSYSNYSSVKSASTKLKASEIIARTAEELAWPLGTSRSIYHHNYSSSKKFSSWNQLGKARPTKEFQKALDKEKPNHFKGRGGYALGADCGVFVNTVLRYSGHDKKMEYGKLDSYFDSSSRWKKASSAKRGDVCITRYSGGMHTKIYLGNGRSAEAAHHGKDFGHITKSKCGGYKIYRAIK